MGNQDLLALKRVLEQWKHSLYGGKHACGFVSVCSVCAHSKVSRGLLAGASLVRFHHILGVPGLCHKFAVHRVVTVIHIFVDCFSNIAHFIAFLFSIMCFGSKVILRA